MSKPLTASTYRILSVVVFVTGVAAFGFGAFLAMVSMYLNNLHGRPAVETITIAVVMGVWALIVSPAMGVYFLVKAKKTRI